MTMIPDRQAPPNARSCTRGTLLALVVLLATLGGVAAQDRGDKAGDHTMSATTLSEVCWSELRFKASKLLLSATADLRVETLPATGTHLSSAPKGAEISLSGSAVTHVTMTSDLPFGRNELVEVWLDPDTSAALQTEKEVSGSKQYWKLRRYTSEGYFQWRAEPKSGEKEREHGEWTRRSKGLIPYDHTPSPTLVVTDSYALLYLISAARLDLEEGRTLQAVIFSKGRLVEIELVARELITRKIELEEIRGDSTQTRSGTVRLRRVTGTGRPLGGDDDAKDSDVDLGFLGMQGDLLVFLEYGTGIPVEVSGRAKTIGKLTVSLQQVHRTDSPPPGPADI